jgi:hypothetical protein
MRRTGRLTWLLLVSFIATSHAAAQTMSSSQAPTAEIDALRSRLRALDDERGSCSNWRSWSEGYGAAIARRSYGLLDVMPKTAEDWSGGTSDLLTVDPRDVAAWLNRAVAQCGSVSVDTGSRIGTHIASTPSHSELQLVRN